MCVSIHKLIKHALCVNVNQEYDAIRLADKGGCSDCGRPVADKMPDFALETQGQKPVHDTQSTLASSTASLLLLSLLLLSSLLFFSVFCWFGVFLCLCVGASVISTRCSETYRIRSACVTLFGFPLWYPSESPRTVIQVQ